MKEWTQKECKKNKKPTKKAQKIIWSNSVDGEDLYTAPVRKFNHEDNNEDDDDDDKDNYPDDQNQKHINEDNSEDDEEYNEEKVDDPQEEEKENETNSAASLISEKE